VVDTDVVSFAFKDDTRATLYDEHFRDRSPIISFMTLAELYRWAESRDWGARRRAKLERHIARFAVHGCSRGLCRVWAQVVAGAARNGTPLDCADAWVAAVAMLLEVSLVTHNGRHYAGVEGLQVICEY